MKKQAMIPGPVHIHWPHESGWPSSVNLDIWPPTFMVEFGKKGEDYGGCIVIGWGGYPRDRDGIRQTYDPAVFARLWAAAPDLLAACEAALARLTGYFPDYGEHRDNPLPVMLRNAIVKAKGL